MANGRAADSSSPTKFAFARTFIEFIEDDDGGLVVVIRNEIALWSDVEAERWTTVPFALCAARGDALAGVLAFYLGFEFGEGRCDSQKRARVSELKQMVSLCT